MPNPKPRREAVRKAQGKAKVKAGAVAWTQARFDRFAEEQRMRQAWCKFRHLGCSSRPGGDCLREILRDQPELAVDL